MKFRYIIASFLCGALFLNSCMDKFADINSDPSVVQKADVRFLFTQELSNLRPYDYWAWFYDYKNMSRWGQMLVPGGSNSAEINLINERSGGSNIKDAIVLAREIEHITSELEKSDPITAASYQHILAMSKVIVTYTAIQNTDMYGSMPYSEAYRVRYGGTLTPKYDTQEQLFDLYLKDLENAIEILTKDKFEVDGQAVTQIALGGQDFVYQGDAKKWAKFANSLRLRVAARLYNHDKARAFAIVEDVAKSPAGMITEIADNFIHNVGNEWYGPNEIPQTGRGNKTMIDFMVENKDPRVRFFFRKNDYNSKVVQAYFDAQAADEKQPNLPSYVAEKVEFEVDKDGRKVFKGWKAPGEPWVRYHGLPVTINADQDKKWVDYFDPENKIFKITLNGKEKTYAATSNFQLDMYKGNINFTYPDAPDVGAVTDEQPRVFYSLYFSAAEVNLYLAEFKLLGANLPGSAADYFKKGIETSVNGWNEIAKKNNIRYYERIYDQEFEEPIKLLDGEVEALLAQPAYQLTGDKLKDLEKVYIQQRFNFIVHPDQMYVTMRRSGVPMKNSDILPFENFTTDGSDYPLPRRFSYLDPSPTDKMRPIVLEALKEQGFNIGFQPEMLNTERVWYDKNAPQFGEGPKL